MSLHMTENSTHFTSGTLYVFNTHLPTALVPRGRDKLLYFQQPEAANNLNVHHAAEDNSATGRWTHPSGMNPEENTQRELRPQQQCSPLRTEALHEARKGNDVLQRNLNVCRGLTAKSVLQ